MKKITMRLSKKKAGAKIQITNKLQITMSKITNPGASIHLFIHAIMQSCNRAISFLLTSFSHLLIFSASHLPSLPPGRQRQERCILALLLSILVMVPFSFAQTDDLEHYLLMQKIENAINMGDFVAFKEICESKISVNFDPPFELHGYVYIDKFIDDFTREFSQFETQKIEWVSKQLEEQFAVQSLTLILKNKQSEKTEYYKFIFFLAKKDEEWKIYYLRGLKI